MTTFDDKAKGKANQGVGAAREKVGDVTGNDSMQAKGARQHAKGDAQEAVGKAKDSVNKATEKVKTALDL